jgi:hypothetical protein
MEMIINQCPGIARGLGFRYDPAQPRNKVFLIRIIDKDFATFDTAADNVVQRSGCIYAGFSWHAGIIA